MSLFHALNSVSKIDRCEIHMTTEISLASEYNLNESGSKVSTGVQGQSYAKEVM